ncbi:hypothetical protein MKX54_11075 [Alkalihalobacillus sp. FSL R5-0424]
MKCYYSSSIQLTKVRIEMYEKYAGRSIYTAVGIIEVRKQILKATFERAANIVKAIGKAFVEAFQRVKKAAITIFEEVVHQSKVKAAEDSLAFRTKRFQQIRKMSPRVTLDINRRPLRIVARSNC